MGALPQSFCIQEQMEQYAAQVAARATQDMNKLYVADALQKTEVEQPQAEAEDAQAQPQPELEAEAE